METEVTGPKCPRCGFDEVEAAAGRYPAALKLRTLLHDQYLVGRILGQGGFGITYLGWDVNLGLKLAIKEYLPMGLATRELDHLTVSVRSGEGGQLFNSGLDMFLDEGRALARFQEHPGVVSVVNFFKTNNTGYLVMSYVDGITVKQFLADRGGKISFAEAKKLFLPVIDALTAVHRADMLHRDISPDNIYLARDGTVKLLDFGAARFAVGEESRSISVILKPGYAPEEQYRTRGKQGPWTDIYALCATIYRSITGAVPPESLDRLEHDDLKRPSELGIAIPASAEAVLIRGLAVRANDRIATMTALRDALVGAESDPTRVQAVAPPPPRQPAPIKTPDSVPRPVVVSKPAAMPWPVTAPAPPPSPPPATSLKFLIAAGIAGVVGLGGIFIAFRPPASVEQPLAVARAAPAAPAPAAPVAAEPVAQAPVVEAPVPLAEAPPLAVAEPVAVAAVAPPPPPVPEKRFISIHTIPSGARVALDGQKLGTSPLESIELPPDAAELQVELAGYEPVRRKLAAGDAEIRVALRRSAKVLKPPTAGKVEKPAEEDEEEVAEVKEPKESEESEADDGEEKPGFWRKVGRGFKNAGGKMLDAGKELKDGFKRGD